MNKELMRQALVALTSSVSTQHGGFIFHDAAIAALQAALAEPPVVNQAAEHWHGLYLAHEETAVDLRQVQLMAAWHGSMHRAMTAISLAMQYLGTRGVGMPYLGTRGVGMPYLGTHETWVYYHLFLWADYGEQAREILKELK